MTFPERRVCAGVLDIRALWRTLLLGALLASGGCGESIQHEKPNILLITLDTTRAERLGCYGYERDTSPNLDRLADTSVVYENAFSNSSWTLPAHASLFTGRFTSSHGARYDPDGPLKILDALREGEISFGRDRARGLSASESTLAGLLSQGGYTTAGIVGGPWMKAIFGLGTGFDDYDDDEISTVNGRLAEQVNDAAIRWLKDHRRQNFFLFLNYYDPHAPYNPPKPYDRAFLPDPDGASEREFLSSMYDGEIRYMDHHIGELFEAMKDLGLYENTLIVITSDHGELLGEHSRYGHGITLYHLELHVPLIIKEPGGGAPPARVNTAVQLVDLFPLILKFAGVPPPREIQGDLPSKIEHPIVAEVYPIGRPGAYTYEGSWRALIDLPFKYLWNSDGDHRLYNLRSDTAEVHNLVNQEAGRARAMDVALEAYLEGLPKPSPTGPEQIVDKDTAEALRSLGYVE